MEVLGNLAGPQMTVNDTCYNAELEFKVSAMQSRQ